LLLFVGFKKARWPRATKVFSEASPSKIKDQKLPPAAKNHGQKTAVMPKLRHGLAEAGHLLPERFARRGENTVSNPLEVPGFLNFA